MVLQKCAGLALCLAAASLQQAKAQSCDPETTPRTFIGNPASLHYAQEEVYYARNPWTLALHGGRLYVGLGNSSNHPPAANAGPVPVYSYSLQTQQWQQEAVLPDEQIDRFVTLDGQIIIPGHDPTANWSLGNFYTYADATWHMTRTIPEGVHVYDLAKHDHRWIAALGTARGGALATSSDQGQSWQIATRTPSRLYSFFLLDRQLYATGVWRKGGMPLWRYQDASLVPVTDDGVGQMFPDTTLSARRQYKIARVLSHPSGQAIAYIGARIHNDHQSLPVGLYIGHLANGQLQVSRIHLDENVEPWDIYLLRDTLYILGNARTGNHSTAYLYAMPWTLSDIPPRWYRVAQFPTPGLARSLAMQATDEAYIGLGAETMPGSLAPLPQETGNIMRIEPCQVE